MSKTITFVDLNEMEEEIFHYYLCGAPIAGFKAFKSAYTIEQKK